VPVLYIAIHHTSAADDSKTWRAGGPGFQRPVWNPIDSAHVAGEQCGDQRKVVVGGDVGDGGQIIQCLAGDMRRQGLEVFPEEKDANAVESCGANPLEV